MANRTGTPRQPATTAAVDRLTSDPDLAPAATTQPMPPVAGRNPGAPLVPARLDAGHVADQRAAELAVKVARVAEHARFAAGYSADVAHTANLLELLGRAGDAQSGRELVSSDLLDQLRSELDGWAKDRGVS